MCCSARLLGDAWTLIWPGASAGSYALIGGGAVLAAAMQGPLAAVVLVIELAHHSDTLMVPLLLAVTEATIIARRLGAPSIYSARLGEQPTDGTDRAANIEPPGYAQPSDVLQEDGVPEGSDSTPTPGGSDPAVPRIADGADVPTRP